ncbi:MAG: hypothetical protein QMD46_08735 [Methanomicrobiales archaeon]|nr:hypothetical protein [Methanomicrobiales archaeon]MDI6875452.1 hypothetical protein [Methanomicrobiales archaeon]
MAVGHCRLPGGLCAVPLHPVGEGLIALVTLFLACIRGEGHPLIFPGPGGMERWVANPIVLRELPDGRCGKV